LKPAKRIDLLLESAAKSGLGTRVLLVGDGPDRDRLDSLAHRLEIGDSVTFAGVRDDVADILRMSDMLVLSSRTGTETFPTVVLEAMATGLPVVTTDVGSVRDMVEDGHSAIVVPPDDREALSTAIETLVNDAAMAMAFGERGRQIVLDRFDVDTMCENRQRLFERLLAGDIL
ncbi:MAG: glycosyltransferase, partial [Candidatus Krumholzibacteria bacterium]|nr:glycosyltransferase [Candidatus Krumholzibacteria bacterium]